MAAVFPIGRGTQDDNNEEDGPRIAGRWLEKAGERVLDKEAVLLKDV